MEFNEIIKKADSLMRKGRLEDAIKLYNEAESFADSPEKRARVMLGIARIHIRKGEIFKAEGLLLDALKLLRESKDKDTFARIYTSLVDLYYHSGNIVAANRYIEKGKPFAEDAKDETKFSFYNICAIVNFDQGKIGIARNYWEKCLEIAKRMNNSELLAISLNNIGEVYRIRGEYEKALDYYRRAYEYSKQEEDYIGMSVNLLNMGDVEHASGNLEKAEEYLRKSVELYERHRSKERLSASYLHLARVLADEGKLEDAVKFAMDAYNLAKEINSKVKMGESLMALGYAYARMKKYGDALKHYNEAKKIFTEIDNKVALSECELHIGEMLVNAEKYESAKFHLERAKNLAEKLSEFKIVQKAIALLSRC